MFKKTYVVILNKYPTNDAITKFPHRLIDILFSEITLSLNVHFFFFF